LLYLSFFWLPLFTHVGEQPYVYDPQSPIILFFGILLYLFIRRLIDYIPQLFSEALNNSLFRKLVVYYCLALLYIRGLFEKEHKIVIFSMTIPNLLFFVNFFVEEISLTSSYWVLASIWFSTGITLYAVDDLCIFLSKLLREEIKLSIFVKYLSQVIDNMDNDNIRAGIFTTPGKLSVAGQAAIFTGVIACIAGLSTTSINTWYNFKRDQMATEQADRDRQARTEQAERDREARA
jgi:hypothetical protein